LSPAPGASRAVAPDWIAVAASIAQASGLPFAIDACTPVGGGCINAGYRVGGAGRRYFVKLNSAARAAMFEAELEGLTAIAATGTLRVPRPVCVGRDADHSWLVLEHLELAHAGGQAMAALGERLAALHRCSAARFGWHRDNTIGATPQHNAWCPDWVEFWRERRLAFQLRLAADNGHRGALQRLGARLLAHVQDFFMHDRPAPSLLHGDLWAGNAACTAGGEPVTYDPACYYGDREADLAMTELFGGFSPGFYAAYRDTWPVPAGYAVRRDLYNLYHVLNHLNLFDGGYGAQAERMIERLLSEVR
jgi:fructosamine-3-kinase